MEIKKSEPQTKTGKLLRKKLGVDEPPAGNNPIDALKVLVKEHRNTTRMSVACGHMGRTEVKLKSGELVKRNIPATVAAELNATSESLAKEATALKSKLKTNLRGVPIYEEFFKHLPFTVPMLASYLCADIDIRRCEKSSSIRRFCGLAVIDGHLERRSGSSKALGGTGTFNGHIRTQLFLCFDALWKNQRHHEENKYLEIWRNARQRDLQKAGVEEHGVKENGQPAHRRLLENGKYVKWDGHAFAYGWHKAADILVEDLYTVWRSLEGLPVWPSYLASKLGYEHGGKISVQAPKFLTLTEAQALVGLGERKVSSEAAE